MNLAGAWLETEGGGRKTQDARRKTQDKRWKKNQRFEVNKIAAQSSKLGWFGLSQDKEHTLEEVGEKFKVTRERIRQIESKALRKIKHHPLSYKLRSFASSS